MHRRIPYVLIVDDDPDVLALAQVTLEGHGMEVVTALSGRDAIAKFEARPAAVCLLDVLMPGLDGFQLLSTLRKLPGGRHTQVILVTALGDAGTQERAEEAGADDFLAKPFHPTELLVRTQSLLTVHKTQSELDSCYRVITTQVQALTELANRRRTSSAMLAHDIRGQLFNAICALDLAGEKRSLEQTKPLWKAARSALNVVSGLVEDLLDLERSEIGESALEVGPLDLGSLCTQVCDLMRPRLARRRVTLECTAPSGLACEGDSSLITRLLSNLLDNAARHAPEGSTVTVAVEQKDKTQQLTVSDHGPGVPDELRDEIFERYVRWDGSCSQRRGYGLGLAFCRMVARLHGGSISLDPEPGLTRFRLVLPLTQDRQSDEGAA